MGQRFIVESVRPHAIGTFPTGPGNGPFGVCSDGLNFFGSHSSTRPSWRGSEHAATSDHVSVSERIHQRMTSCFRVPRAYHTLFDTLTGVVVYSFFLKMN